MAVIAFFKKNDRMHAWKKMSASEKNAEIVANKGKNPGRGKKFPVELQERVSWRSAFGFLCAFSCLVL